MVLDMHSLLGQCLDARVDVVKQAMQAAGCARMAAAEAVECISGYAPCIECVNECAAAVDIPQYAPGHKLT